MGKSNRIRCTMHHVNKLLSGIGVVLLGSTILLSCTNPHATRMDERASFGFREGMHRRDHNEATALHMAVWRGDAAVVEALLSQIPETEARVAIICQEFSPNRATKLHMSLSIG